MYNSAQHIDVKLNQDYSEFIFEENYKAIILCDGIGEFANSGIVSKKVSEVMIEKKYEYLNQLFCDAEILEMKDKVTEGGTTILFARNNGNDDLNIEFVGNGGCIQLNGAFAKNQNNLITYRYNHLINPHINAEGALTRHLSHKSSKTELKSGKLKIELNNDLGDIIIFFTDGITSLEENVIIEDNEGRFWRNESNAIQFILNDLHNFLVQHNNSDIFQDELISFNKNVLKSLKENNFLEDDASLALIVTENTLNYYKTLND